jgi:hypothetical protein
VIDMLQQGFSNDVNVAGEHLAHERAPGGGDDDVGTALVVDVGGTDDQAGLFQLRRLIGETAAAVDVTPATSNLLRIQSSATVRGASNT